MPQAVSSTSSVSGGLRNRRDRDRGSDNSNTGADAEAVLIGRDGRDIRILSLDGGGARALTQLLILRQIFNTPELRNIKPCEFFDLIVGTNTGGILAVLLGKLEFSIEQAFQTFKGLLRKVFVPSAWSRYQYDAVLLESEFKHIISQSGLNPPLDPETATLRASPDKCQVVVVARRSAFIDSPPKLFRSYSLPHGDVDVDSVPIWKALRATCAGRGQFDTIVIDDVCYGDGGLLTNNPCVIAIRQAQELFPGQRIGIVCSLGTGVTKPVGNVTTFALTIIFSLVMWLLELSVPIDVASLVHSSRAVDQEAYRICSDGPDSPYFRFDPPFVGELAVERTGTSRLTSYTEAYLAETDQQIKLKRLWYMSISRRTMPPAQPLHYSFARDVDALKRSLSASNALPYTELVIKIEELTRHLSMFGNAPILSENLSSKEPIFKVHKEPATIVPPNGRVKSGLVSPAAVHTRSSDDSGGVSDFARPSPLKTSAPVIIRFYDQGLGKFVEWQPFYGWLWPTPPIVDQVCDYNNAIIKESCVVTVVSRFTSLDSIQTQAMLDHVSYISRAPAIMTQVALGDKLHVLRIFAIRNVVWLACRRVSGGNPGFIPLKAVVRRGNPPAALPRQITVPIHGSARAFIATAKFQDFLGKWRTANIVGIVQPFRISYHEALPTSAEGAHRTQIRWLHFPYSSLLSIARSQTTEVVIRLRDKERERDVHIHFSTAIGASQFWDDIDHMRPVTRKFTEVIDGGRLEAEEGVVKTRRYSESDCVIDKSKVPVFLSGRLKIQGLSMLRLPKEDFKYKH